MTLRYALLGLLDQRAGTGYDLTRRFAAGIEQFAWGARHSQIYPELNRLEGEGLIAVQSLGARGKKVYAVTGTGREQLYEWLLATDERRGTVRDEFVLRLFLLGSLPVSQRLTVLGEVERHAREQYRQIEEDRRADGVPARSAMAATYGLFSYAAVVEWAAWAVQRLADGHDLNATELPLLLPGTARPER